MTVIILTSRLSALLVLSSFANVLNIFWTICLCPTDIITVLCHRTRVYLPSLHTAVWYKFLVPPEATFLFFSFFFSSGCKKMKEIPCPLRWCATILTGAANNWAIMIGRNKQFSNHDEVEAISPQREMRRMWSSRMRNQLRGRGGHNVCRAIFFLMQM